MSLSVRSFFHGATSTWSYLVADSTTHVAAIIDPVLDFDSASGRVWHECAKRLLEPVRTNALRVDWILETHAHADHLTAAAWLKGALECDGDAPNVAVGAGIVDVQNHFAQVLGLGDDFISSGSQFDHLFVDDERFNIGSLEVQVIATPGHTPDSICYRIGDALFVGDTLLAPRLGTARCDFPGGDAAMLYRSIQRLYELPDATRVFLCHDYPAADSAPLSETTIAAQKSENVQLRGDTIEGDYVAMRAKRDATLAVPKLLYPALQVNICAGRLPEADAQGRRFLRVPLRVED
ncbi:MAG: MBL fold metallo-hydrolase [Rudaea sp.]